MTAVARSRLVHTGIEDAVGEGARRSAQSSTNTPLLHADTTRRVGRADAVAPVLRKSDFVTMTACVADGTLQVNGQRRIPDA